MTHRQQSYPRREGGREENVLLRLLTACSYSGGVSVCGEIVGLPLAGGVVASAFL